MENTGWLGRHLEKFTETQRSDESSRKVFARRSYEHKVQDKEVQHEWLA